VDTRINNRLLAAAVEETLETMFFTSTIAPADDFSEVPDDCIRASIDFVSETSGSLELAIPSIVARRITAGLAGEDHENVSLAEAEQGVCEMANVICGLMLSRSDAGLGFTLGPPELLTPSQDEPDARFHRQAVSTTRCRVHSEIGHLFVSLSLAE